MAKFKATGALDLGGSKTETRTVLDRAADPEHGVPQDITHDEVHGTVEHYEEGDDVDVSNLTDAQVKALVDDGRIVAVGRGSTADATSSGSAPKSTRKSTAKRSGSRSR